MIIITCIMIIVTIMLIVTMMIIVTIMNIVLSNPDDAAATRYAGEPWTDRGDARISLFKTTRPKDGRIIIIIWAQRLNAGHFRCDSYLPCFLPHLDCPPCLGGLGSVHSG